MCSNNKKIGGQKYLSYLKIIKLLLGYAVYMLYICRILKYNTMKCTNCKADTDQVRTDHRKNINGKLIRLIPEGEAWCPKCVTIKGLKTLKQINDERK